MGPATASLRSTTAAPRSSLPPARLPRHSLATAGARAPAIRKRSQAIKIYRLSLLVGFGYGDTSDDTLSRPNLDYRWFFGANHPLHANVSVAARFGEEMLATLEIDPRVNHIAVVFDHRIRGHVKEARVRENRTAAAPLSPGGGLSRAKGWAIGRHTVCARRSGSLIV
jgi:hypothetical protein